MASQRPMLCTGGAQTQSCGPWNPMGTLVARMEEVERKGQEEREKAKEK